MRLKGRKTKKRRRHYLLEPGWRADNAIQGLGRTHRAAQVSAPFFRVCTTDVHGEKRFTSTIARRLDTLGALTKGQRETASQGMFRAEDNLESMIARGCLRALYRDIVQGRIAGMGLELFEDWTGLKLVTKEGQLLDELPPIQRFLNRILALPIAMQNLIFAEFMERIASQTERARAAGTLDVGLEELRGDQISAGEAQTIRTDPLTGALTQLVPVHVEQNMYYASATEISARHPRLRMMQNSASQKVALIAPAPRHSFDEMGDLHLERQILRPSSTGWISEADFEKSHWCEINADHFKRAWNEECEGLPRKKCQTIWLLTGLILPIWSSVPGENQRIYRVRLEDGRALLGRALSEEEAAVLRGRVMEVNTSDPASIFDAVQNGARQVELGQGLMLQRKRVAGHMRLEITGADKATLDWLRALG